MIDQLRMPHMDTGLLHSADQGLPHSITQVWAGPAIMPGPNAYRPNSKTPIPKAASSVLAHTPPATVLTSMCRLLGPSKKCAVFVRASRVTTARADAPLHRFFGNDAIEKQRKPSGYLLKQPSHFDLEICPGDKPALQCEGNPHSGPRN